MCSEDEQRVEPAPSLVHRLGNKVGREACTGEVIAMFERIVDLCIRHAIKNCVEHAQTDTAVMDRPTDLPDSNQQSNTSSTRRRTPLPFLEGMVMWSILSR
jgi:hypothetical protein